MTTASASLTFTRSLQAAGLGTKAVAVLLGSLFIAAAAQVEVPMLPVPMTMQTFAVLSVGMLYGWRLGALTLLAYHLEAALGLPVYAGWANLAVVMAKPFTAGYLVGFVAAAMAAGFLVERVRGLGGAALAVVAGSVLVYAFGLAWLTVMLGGDVQAAIAGGLLPFLLGDLVKAVLAVAVREVAGRVSVGL